LDAAKCRGRRVNRKRPSISQKGGSGPKNEKKNKKKSEREGGANKGRGVRGGDQKITGRGQGRVEGADTIA